MQGSGQYQESIAAAKQAILLDPDVPFPYATMAYGYIYLDRFEEAAGPLQLASQRKIEIPDLTELRYHLAFLNGDRDGMERAAASAGGEPAAEGRLSHMQSLVLARSGQLRLSRKMSDRAVNLAEQARQTGAAALCEAGAAVSAAVAGDLGAARRSADIVLDRSRGRDAQYGAALALALAGEFVRSQTLAADLGKRFPEDTSVQYSYLPTLRALSALDRGEAAMAIELLRPAERYELAVPAIAFNWFFGAMYPNYVRGLAYLALQQTNDAGGGVPENRRPPRARAGRSDRRVGPPAIGENLCLVRRPGERRRPRTKRSWMLWANADAGAAGSRAGPSGARQSALSE